MTVYIYTRVSTTLQADDGNSLDTQISQLKSYAHVKREVIVSHIESNYATEF